MKENLILYRRRLLHRLSRVGEDIAQAAAGISPAGWHTTTADGETPHRILAHLRAVEAQAFFVRLRRILDEEAPFLPLLDDQKWMEEHYDPAEPPEEMLAEYLALRSQELSWLKDIQAQDWNRTGRHPWWGIRALQWWVEQTLHYSEEKLQKLLAASKK